MYLKRVNTGLSTETQAILGLRALRILTRAVLQSVLLCETAELLPELPWLSNSPGMLEQEVLLVKPAFGCP